MHKYHGNIGSRSHLDNYLKKDNIYVKSNPVLPLSYKMKMEFDKIN